MEGAARVFAGEFSRSTLVQPMGDSGAPEGVVTPSGACCRQIFFAGVLTEAGESGDMAHCRVADPTGAFDLISWRKGALKDAITTIPIPSFVTVTGLAQMNQNRRPGSPTIRPEQILPIDRATRDQIYLSTVEYTLHRIGQMRLAIHGESADDNIRRALRHYATTSKDLQELLEMVEHVVLGIRPPETAPVVVAGDVIAEVRELVGTAPGPQGIAVEEVIAVLTGKGISKEAVLAALELLIVDDECYQPRKGYVRLL
jgi:RPA family protein